MILEFIHEAIERLWKRRDLNADTITYFMVKDPKFPRFYLLSKIHKQLHYFKLRFLYRKYIFFFRLSFATFGPGSIILHKKY